jgi:hypothetical protein
VSGLFNPQGDRQGGLFGGMGQRRLPESGPVREATPAPREVSRDGNPFPNMVRDRDQLSRLWIHIAQVLSDNIRQRSVGEEEPQQGLPTMGGGTQETWERFREVEQSEGMNTVSDGSYVYSDEELAVFTPSGMPTQNNPAPEFRIGDNQIAQFALGAGFDRQQAVIATAIALAESAGSTAAVGDAQLRSKKWGASIGLWQVRSLNDPASGNQVDRMRDAMSLFDPSFNARAAYAISGQGQNWDPWTVFKTGAYRQYLGRAERAVRDAMSAQTEGVR